jgi:hypothetical protein
MGFDTERLALRGRLAEKEAQLRQLGLSIEGDVAAVREMLPAFAAIEDLRPDVAAAQTVELAGKHAEYMGMVREITAMRKALGL